MKATNRRVVGGGGKGRIRNAFLHFASGPHQKWCELFRKNVFSRLVHAISGVVRSPESENPEIQKFTIEKCIFVFCIRTTPEMVWNATQKRFIRVVHIISDVVHNSKSTIRKSRKAFLYSASGPHQKWCECRAKTVSPAWFTPSLAWSGIRNLESKNPEIQKFTIQKCILVFLHPDHTRNGVNCFAKTFHPAWFTPSLAWSGIRNPKSRNPEIKNPQQSATQKSGTSNAIK